MSATTPEGAKIVGVDIFGPSTNDGKKLIAFYRDTLGMTPTAGGDPEDTGAEFEFPDGTTFGVYQPEHAKPGGGYMALFAVRDINAAVAHFRANGAQLSDVLETPVCFMSFGADPDGNGFAIHKRKHG
ncbi:MAG TPA: VOC family protein [Candidatus Eremiobacteraceae bacterium]|nr:VOC family protein [Candidatus Eremiobacteraceae bacterium]